MVAVLRSGGASDGSLHRTCLSLVPPRAHEAVPQGREVRHDEVPDRTAPVPARRSWPKPAAPGFRVLAPAAREAEGAPHLRPDGEAVQPHLSRGEPSPRRDRRELAATPRV